MGERTEGSAKRNPAVVLYITPGSKSILLSSVGIEKYKNSRGRGLSERKTLVSLAPQIPEKGKGELRREKQKMNMLHISRISRGEDRNSSKVSGGVV